MQNFWPSSGFDQLGRDARGWLVPTDDYLRLWLARPELALVPESCAAEQALHAALALQPSRAVTPAELARLADPDARANYALFVRFRDALQSAGTLEAYYLGLFRGGSVDLPPLFVDLLAQAIVRNVLRGASDVYALRAGEMLFRAQRISTEGGQILAGDRDAIDLLNETGGLGEIGRLLTQANAPMHTLELQVLADDNAARYWQDGDRHSFLLDLTHEVSNDLSHGLTLTMTRARSGLSALARVLEQWIAHFLGVAVHIRPEPRIDDPGWRWHIGLDAQATALLNDLYEGHAVEPKRQQRLVSLFRLDFADPQEMRADVAGKPVYLGLAMNADRVVKLKPQNLLINLPLAAAM